MAAVCAGVVGDRGTDVRAVEWLEGDETRLHGRCRENCASADQDCTIRVPSRPCFSGQ